MKFWKARGHNAKVHPKGIGFSWLRIELSGGFL
jgi:hypothetical protein